MKCIFNPGVVCPFYEAHRELGYKPNLREIQDKECPQCPNGPNSFRRDRRKIQPLVQSLGEYIV